MTNHRTIQPDARKVIVGVDTHKHVHVAVAIEPTSLDSVFARIDESILSTEDKDKLTDVLFSVGLHDVTPCHRRRPCPLPIASQSQIK